MGVNFLADLGGALRFISCSWNSISVGFTEKLLELSSGFKSVLEGGW